MVVSQLIAAPDPTSVALCAEGRAPLSYAELRRLVASTAEVVRNRGIGAADRLAVVLPNGPEMAAAFLGLSAVAAVAPLNPAFKEAELEFYLADLRPAALVASREQEKACAVARRLGIDVLLLEGDATRGAGCFTLTSDRQGVFAAPSVPPTPDDPALLLHTSGTTARPKLVSLTHANLCASARNIAASLGLAPADCCLNVMPLFHVHGLLAALLGSLSAGASVYCSSGFNGHRFFGWLRDSRATWYTAVPSMHQAVLSRARTNRHVLDQHSLRFVRSCSAPLPLQAWCALEDVFGVPVVSAYGMTEASHQISCTPMRYPADKRGSVGRPTGTEIAIADEDGRRVPPGCRGEVIIRGASVIRAYAANPEADARSFTEGWFRTGDQGVQDEDGYLTLTGRLKEIINTGGEKVAPLEVDAVLMEHPGVAQAVAFGMPDASLGERVAAVVVLEAGSDLTPERLRAFAADRLVKFKVPRTIVTVDAIPTGPTGKFQRTALARQLGLA